MKTEDLIKKLSNNAKPVALFRWGHEVLRWLGVSVLCISLGLAFLGLRQDWKLLLNDPQLIIQSLLLLATALASAIAAFVLSVPAEKKSIWLKLFPLVPVIGWIIVISLGISQLNSSELRVSPTGMICIVDVTLIALIPALVGFFIISKAAPIESGWVGFLALLAASSLGAFATQWSCSNSNPIHLLVWHVLPVVLIALLGIKLGRSILKW